LTGPAKAVPLLQSSLLGSPGSSRALVTKLSQLPPGCNKKAFAGGRGGIDLSRGSSPTLV
jgi:hypothetical protein